MSEVAISLENLSKLYRLGQGMEAGYTTLRESITNAFRSPFQWIANRAKGRAKNEDAFIWALKDVFMEIKAGEAVGIIGANGAGKSTLLKILSKITLPTEGRASVFGRVGSLLEVGTGFHPELTGRENIFLNGAILGMKKAEIQRKFDSIVSFAEIEKFLDTPVKFYSSGMYVRLAFGVAAHMDPEILLVDEVLAVGDAAFQKKCLGTMGDVAKQGRTVLFVSHNMGAIQSLCSRVILLEKGKVIHSGEPARVITDYLDQSSVRSFDPAAWTVENDQFRMIDIFVEQNDMVNPLLLDPQDDVKINIRYELYQKLSRVLLGFDVYSAEGLHLFRTYDLASYGMGERTAGEYISVLTFPKGLLQFGDYFIEFLAGVHRKGWITRNAFRLKLTLQGPRTTDVDYPGVFQPLGTWEIKKVSVELKAHKEPVS